MNKQIQEWLSLSPTVSSNYLPANKEIIELVRELAKQNEIMILALQEIAEFNGQKVVGISRNGAISGFQRNLNVAKKCLARIEAMENRE